MQTNYGIGPSHTNTINICFELKYRDVNIYMHALILLL